MAKDCDVCQTNDKIMFFAGVVAFGAFSFWMMGNAARELASGNFSIIGFAFDIFAMFFFGGLAVLVVVRLVKRAWYCKAGHAWVRHPKTKWWNEYTDCLYCFQPKDE